MKSFFENKVNLILAIIVLAVAVLIIIPTFSRGCATSTSNGEILTTAATTATTAETTTKETKPKSTSSDVKITDSKVEIKKKNAKNSSTASASKKSDPRSKSSSSKTSSKSSKKSSSSKVYATAATAETKADYNTQWNAGYLVAVDNPDTSYSCGHIELSDKDREILEKLCMGELGSGGFTGAALIAQAVKNAMYFDGYTSVSDVISSYKYTGKLTTPTKRVKDAVVYIFDMDKNAVQHRILYMYNPTLMPDKFSKDHESMRYICTYQDVRFFDR